MIDRETIRVFREIGRDLFVAGLTTSHGGNMSVRDGDRVIITRRGSMLGRLTDDDLIETGMEPCTADERCSREIVVHRAIYAATDARAIVHAHPVHTVYRSLVGDTIAPADSESVYVLGASVPVFAPATSIAPVQTEAIVTPARCISARVAGISPRATTARGAVSSTSSMPSSNSSRISSFCAGISRAVRR